VSTLTEATKKIREYWERRKAQSQRDIEYADAFLTMLSEFDVSVPEQKLDNSILAQLMQSIDGISTRISALETKTTRRDVTYQIRGEAKEKIKQNLIEDLRTLVKTERHPFTADEVSKHLGIDYYKAVVLMRDAAKTVSDIKLTQGKRRKLFVSYEEPAASTGLNGMMTKLTA
jgi:hypothetical protein